MGRRERLALAAIVVVALAVRLAFLFGERGDVLFEHPPLDEQRYVDEARALAAGRADPAPSWQPPGLQYVLAATFRVAGPGLLVPRVLQAIVSAASCLLLFALGRRLFGVRVGLAAAAMLALHGVVVFHGHELLPAIWMLFLDLLAVWALHVARERRSWRVSLGAGLALGTSAVFAPTILPFALVAAWWLRRPAAIAALLVGVLVPLAPVAWRNSRAAGELVLVSTNAGLNFHIGNNASYRTTFTLRPGRHWQELTSEPARLGIADEATAGASRYFLGKGLSFYRDDPAGAARLALRKTYLFFNGGEIPRDTDLHAAREGSPLLRVLVWAGPLRFPDGLLIPLALVGVALTWRERRRLGLVLGFLVVQAVVVAAFFVTSRHRLPTLPMFALLAAAAVPAALARRRAALAMGVGLIVLLNVPTWETRLSFAGERELYRGIAERARHRLPAAVEAFRRGTRLAPTDARLWFELGNTLDGMGRPEAAVPAWARAAEVDPWDSRPRRRAAVALMRLGDAEGAIAMLQANLDAGQRDAAHYAPDHLNLAFARARRGETERAVAHLRAATADPVYLRDKLPRMAAAALDEAAIADAAFWSAVAEVGRAIGVELVPGQ